MERTGKILSASDQRLAARIRACSGRASLQPVASSPRRDPKSPSQAGETEIFTGESVEYLVEIRNIKNPAAPDLSAL